MQLIPPMEVARWEASPDPSSRLLGGVQLAEGATAEQLARALQGESDPRELMAGIVGILIADPGERAAGRLEVNLESGRTFALLCNFADTEDAPPHIALGMMRVFQTQ